VTVNTLDYAVGYLAEAAQLPYFELLPETDLGEVYRGDTIFLPPWEARDQRGVLLDLTNATVWFTAKVDLASLDSDPGVIQRSTGVGGIMILNPALGTYQVTIDPASTQELTDDTAFIFDVQVRTMTPTTATVKRGTLIVVRDVTRTYA
jgi:hypothetical protein